MSQALRALVGARVSVLTGPEKVSHIAQIETATKWAESKGYKIVGQFEDLGVSASKRPEDRPDLGLWLTDEGADKWDVIIWSKMDRAFRSTRHCVDFAKWAEEKSKVVVFAEDNLLLDYRPGAAKGIDAMMAELFVYIGSFFAQLELNRFKTRALDFQRTLRGTDRWSTGLPPLGYRLVDHPSGRGKGLEPDPEGRALLYEIAGKLLDGWSFVRVVNWLNDTGQLTNRDRAKVARGEPPQETRPWNVSGLMKIMTYPRTQGLKMAKGQTVLDAKGQPVRVGPPTFDPDLWLQIQAEVEKRRINRRQPSETKNAMLGIGFCGVCGRSLQQQFNRRKPEYRYYRCGGAPSPCKGIHIRAEKLEAQLEAQFIDEYGDEPATRRVFVPGEDRSHELDEVKRSIARLHMESDAGLIVGDDDEREWIERLKGLVERRTTLEVEPYRAAAYIEEPTGESNAEVWRRSDSEGRRSLLLDEGLTFALDQVDPPVIHFRDPRENTRVLEGVAAEVHATAWADD